MNCRHCYAPLQYDFLDLGYAPPSNAYLDFSDLTKPEKYYPLRVKVCNHCWLVQTEDHAQANELFCADYAYYSSTSSGWLSHAENYSKTITQRLKLDENSFVIEIAANDGYLLKFFVSAGIPCLGIEPTAGTAAAAKRLGIQVLQEFFSEKLGLQLVANHQQADLIIGNNVYAHVPDINDFTRGLKAALKPGGTITLEFPHLLQLIERNQFDTIYHEHFSYLSLHVVERIFKVCGLRIWEIEKLATHGGSLRVYGCHDEDERNTSSSVDSVLAEETHGGLQSMSVYRSLQARADQTKNSLLSFLIEKKLAGKSVAAYGAAAKGNTLLNYAGIKPDLLPWVCDAALAKQGKFLPGSHLPIVPPAVLSDQRPDYLLILPWNIATEIMQQNSALADLGTKFVIAVPDLKIL